MKIEVKKRKIYTHAGWVLEETDTGTITLHQNGYHRNFGKLEELKSLAKIINRFIHDVETEGFVKVVIQ